MGNLFYRGVAPGEIESMTYNRIRYWNKWHELMSKAEEDVLKNTKKGRSKKGK